MKSLIFGIVLLSSLYAYEDLGVYGETKEIKERDFVELLNEKAEAIDYEKLKKDMDAAVEKSLILNSSLKTCTQTKKRVFEPLIDIPNDVKLPYTEVILQSKEKKYNILKENHISMPYNIMFINANDEIQIELARLYKHELKDKIKILMVSGNYNQIAKDPILFDTQVSRDGIENKAFALECVPSIYSQNKNYTFDIVEYNPQELLKTKEEKNAK